MSKRRKNKLIDTPNEVYRVAVMNPEKPDGRLLLRPFQSRQIRRDKLSRKTKKAIKGFHFVEDKNKRAEWDDLWEYHQKVKHLYQLKRKRRENDL